MAFLRSEVDVYPTPPNSGDEYPGREWPRLPLFTCMAVMRSPAPDQDGLVYLDLETLDGEFIATIKSNGCDGILRCRDNSSRFVFYLTNEVATAIIGASFIDKGAAWDLHELLDDLSRKTNRPQIVQSSTRKSSFRLTEPDTNTPPEIPAPPAEDDEFGEFQG